MSIDVGVLERSHAVAMVRGAFRWDDVGTWDAIGRIRERDARGNVTVGPASLHNVTDCIVWSDDEPIVVSDVSDLIVVRANGRILVTHRRRAADLKQLLDALPPAIRDLA